MVPVKYLIPFYIMSIATLKKKTNAQYNNMSVSKPLFSLNGTTRNQGYIGQTSLSRFLSRTLIRNGGYRNSGGCCGKFVIGRIVQSSVTTTENNKVVKTSVINNSGLLRTKYPWIWRPQPYSTVKTDSNQLLNTQQLYIENLQKKTLNVINSCVKPQPPKPKCCSNNLNSLFKPRYTAFNNTGTPVITTPDNKLTSITQEQYLLQLDKKCVINNEFKIITNMRGTPLPSHA